MGVKFNPFTSKLDIVDSPSGEFSDIELALGTDTAPSISFTGDPNTGIYSPGADQVAISTGGTGRLFVDAAGSVGIGKAPSYALDVAGSIQITNAQGIRALNSTGTSYRLLTPGGDDNLYLGGNEANSNEAIVFRANDTERMRLDSSGRLGLGTSSPDTKLEISNGSTGTTSVITALRISGISDDSQVIEFKNNHTSGTGVRAKITSDGDGIAQSYGTLKFWTGRTLNSPSVAMKIDSLGNVGIGTSSPGSILHTKGGPITFETTGSTDADREFRFNVDGTNYAWLRVPVGSGGALALAT